MATDGMDKREASDADLEAMLADLKKRTRDEED